VQHFAGDDLKYVYSAAHTPIGEVSPGERFEVSTEDCFTRRFREPEGFTAENIQWVDENLNGLTGPISVRGAQPGQVVAVRIEALTVTTPGSVVLSRYSFPSPIDWWSEEIGCKSCPVENNAIVFSERLRIPIQPLIGCIATAPKRETTLSRCEGPYGGNLDCNEITAGATVILPVTVSGAYLYFGDCKARMADGEVVACPEVGTLITASVALRPGPARMHCPRVETADSLITLVSARTLEDACRNAFKYMLWWVVDDFGLAQEDAAMLMGMVAHTGICQMSNPLLTAKCIMPRRYLSH
jgi:amidase